MGAAPTFPVADRAGTPAPDGHTPSGGPGPARPDGPVFLGSAAATRADRRRAVAAGAVLVAAFAATGPWAHRPVGTAPDFAVIYDTAVIVLDLVTALLLYAQYRQVRESSFLALACGYLFTPLLMAAHALSFPNAFGPGSLIGGPQTTAWLWMGWHGLFPVYVAGYALLARRDRRPGARPARPPAAALAVGGTVALAAAAIFLVTAGESLLPELMLGDQYRSPATQAVLAAGWGAHLVALALLVWATRLGRRIDLWIAVTLTALLIDLALSAVLVSGRYQLGWFLGRVYGCLGASFVLAVLLRQMVALYGGAVAAGERLRASEAKYRTLFDAIDEGFALFEMIYDRAGTPVDFRYAETNPAFERHAGRRPRPGQTMRELFPEAEDMWLADYAEVARTGRPKRFVDRVGGLDRWFDVYVFPAGPAAPGRLAALFRDVTAERRAEQALRESEGRLRLALDAAGMGSFVWYPAEDRTEADARLLELFGLPAGLALTHAAAIATLVHPDDRERNDAAVRRACDPAGDGSLRDEFRVVRPDGVVRWLAITGRTEFAGDPPRAVRLAGVAADVTDRRQAEERHAFLLRLSDALRPLADPVAIQEAATHLLGSRYGASRALYAEFVVEEGRDLVVVEREYRAAGAASFVGRHPAERFGPDLTDLRAGRVIAVPDVEAEAAGDDLKAVWRGLGVRARVGVPLVKDGRLVAGLGRHAAAPRAWTAADVELVTDVAERTWAAVARARAEAALRASEERYRSLFETMSQGYCEGQIIRDADGKAVDARYLELNPAWGRFAGVPLAEALGRLAREVTPGMEDWWIETVGRVAATGEAEHIEHELVALDRWFGAYIYPRPGDRYVTVFEDITERKRAEQALRESEERQAFLLKLSDALRPLADPVVVQQVTARMLGTQLAVDRCYYAEFDWSGGVLYIHREYLRSAAAVSAVGSHPISLFNDLLVHSHKGDPLACDEIGAHPVFGGEAAAYRARGTDAFILVPLVKQGVMVACMCVTMEVARHWPRAEVELVREVSERTWDAVGRAKAEAALRASEEKYRALFESMDEAYAVVEVIRDPAGRWADFLFLEVNPAFVKHTGMPDPVGRTATQLLGTPNPRWAELYGRVADTGEPVRLEEAEPTLDRVFDLYIFRLGGPGSRRVAVLFTNVTERRRAAEALRGARDELEARVAERTADLGRLVEQLRAEVRDRERAEAARTELLRRLATAQEDERRRVARDLHDQTGQLLAGLSLAVKAVETAGPLPPPAADRLVEVHRVADELGRQVHGLAVRLRPTALDDLGLPAALGQLAGDWSGRTGVPVDLQVAGLSAARLPSEVETTLFRLVQEALTNVAKHATARSVSVVVSRHDGTATAVVEDDGVGFDPEAIGRGRLGLLGMRERLGLAGGGLDVESAPGGGTTVIARVPVPAREGGVAP